MLRPYFSGIIFARDWSCHTVRLNNRAVGMETCIIL
jgi:hypothetical protein